MPFTLKNALILDPRSGFFQKRADIFIDKGEISKISKNLRPKGKVIDEAGLAVSPGWVDMNVRINDPGFEYKETLESTLQQAKRGGFNRITTLPTTDPIIQTKDQVHSLIQKGKSLGVQVLPVCALSEDLKEEKLNDLHDLMNSGAAGFSDEDRSSDPEIISNALRYLDGSGGILFERATEPGLTDGAQVNEGLMSTRLGFKGFSIEAESVRISRDLDLVRMNGGKVHFYKVSTIEGLKLIKRGKSEGLNISCDVPAYLFFLDETLVDGYDTRYKLDPPLQPKKTRDAYSRFLLDGTIDAISSSHSPQDIESRDLEFDRASFGGRFLETCFPSFWTGVGKSIDRKLIPQLFSLGPASILNLELPIIEKGNKADLTIFQLGKNWDYSGEEGKEYSDPLAGSNFSARVIATISGNNLSLAS